MKESVARKHLLSILQPFTWDWALIPGCHIFSSDFLDTIKNQTQNNLDFVIPLKSWHPGQVTLFWVGGMKWGKMAIHFAMLCISCTLFMPIHPSSSSWWRLVKNSFFKKELNPKCDFYRVIQMYEYRNTGFEMSSNRTDLMRSALIRYFNHK